MRCCRHGKAVPVAARLQDEGELELGRLARGTVIEPEGLEGVGLARLDDGGDRLTPRPHELQGLDEVGLAPGVGPVHHGAADWRRPPSLKVLPFCP